MKPHALNSPRAAIGEIARNPAGPDREEEGHQEIRVVIEERERNPKSRQPAEWRESRLLDVQHREYSAGEAGLLP